jgi:hypothetical protein
VFSADIHQYSRGEGQKDFQFGEDFHYWQDAERQRTAQIGKAYNNYGNKQIHVLREWHHQSPQDGKFRNVEYTIDDKNQTCTCKQMSYDFRPLHIPMNASHVSQQYIGGSGNFMGSILSNTYVAQFNSTETPGEHFRWQGVYTDRDIGCFPVEDTFESFDPVKKEHMTTHTSFFNLVIGITNADAFSKPEFCPHSADCQ